MNSIFDMLLFEQFMRTFYSVYKITKSIDLKKSAKF